MDPRGRSRTDADYGMGEYEFDADSLGLIDEDELTERLSATFASDSYRPPRMPAVAMEIMALASDPDVHFNRIEKLLEQDAVLAGEVLSMARSAEMAGRASANIDSLRGALVRVGMSRLRDVVLGAAMNMRVFRCKSYQGVMERLRYHCRATAYLARLVSRYTAIDENRAFMAGLMHDVGIAGILLVLGEQPRGKKPPELTLLWPAIERAHTRAGARMVELWQLPEEVSQAVDAHHRVLIEGEGHPLAAIVCIAESMSDEFNLGLVPEQPDDKTAAALKSSGLLQHSALDKNDEMVQWRACEALGIERSTLDLVRKDAEALRGRPAPAG